MKTTVERMRQIDPRAYRYIIVGHDGEPIQVNLHGKAIRWAFASKAAAESNLRRVRRFRPDAELA